ncbi:MAG: phosphatidate cytidylyltransferase, partial [Pseudomonadota bacterium]
GAVFAALVTLICLLMAFEWVQMTCIHPSRFGLAVLSFVTVAAALAVLMGHALIAFSIIVVVAFFGFLGPLILNARAGFWIGAGAIYTAIPAVSLIWMREGDGGGVLIAWLLIAIWASDVGGYIFGRWLGGAKLIPMVSPNKTWSGALGGALLAGIASMIVATGFGLGAPLSVAFLGVVVSILAQVGDVVESALKRAFQVKDSGRLIPGHGGVMDRVDGIAFAAPVVALALSLSNRFMG